MEEIPGSNGSGHIEPPPTLVEEPQPPFLLGVFKGPNGLRAGWRVLVYAGIVFIIFFLLRLLRRGHAHRTGDLDSPAAMIVGEWVGFAIFAFAAWIMSRIERQAWGNYGMPWRKAFRSRFWIGALFGFVALTCVIGCLHLAHCYSIEGLALHGPQLWRYAGLWLLGFLGVGFMEEFMARGYLQYTLASGMGFWPAALITSGMFFAGHIANSGETIIGLVDVFLFGMLACFMWWRTGDLWLAVGFHALWDWGLSFFYSVPNSGLQSVGYLFKIRVQGPVWLSGGNAGPEGSIINIVFDVLYFVIVAVAFPRREFVGMNDRREAATMASHTRESIVIDPSALRG